MNNYAVLVEKLVRHFGKMQAVDEIDLGVAQGEIYGFLIGAVLSYAINHYKG